MKPLYIKGDVFNYINNLPETTQPPALSGWAIIPQRDVPTDSISTTLVTVDADTVLLEYNTVFPVFKGAVLASTNELFREWYAERLAHDSLDTPPMLTWLRHTRKPHGQLQSVDYYQILPFKHLLYIAPNGAVFVSSFATFTFGIGSGDLSGFLSHTVRATSPVGDFATEFDAALHRQGWPIVERVVLQHGGRSLQALSDSSSLQRHLFFAKDGFVIGFENTKDSDDGFLVVVPYPLFNKQFKL